MLWVKSVHLILMVAWFAGLFYLPRLFVYHALSSDSISNERFKIMERKLYYGIMAPGAVLTIISGIWLSLYKYQHSQPANWFYAKLFCVFLLVLFHLYCGKLRKDFRENRNQHKDTFYRWLNEVPTVLLFAIIILITVKPF